MEKIEKLTLGLYPTPLQELSGMSELLGGGKRLFLKREDLCGIGLGEIKSESWNTCWRRRWPRAVTVL